MSNALISHLLMVEGDMRISVLHEAPPVPRPPTTALLCPPSCLANRVSQLNQQNNFLLDKTRNVLIAEWDDTGRAGQWAGWLVAVLISRYEM